MFLLFLCTSSFAYFGRDWKTMCQSAIQDDGLVVLIPSRSSIDLYANCKILRQGIL